MIAAILFCRVAVNVTTPAQREGHGGQKPPAKDDRRRETPCQRPRMEMSMTPPCHLMACLQNMITYTRLLRDQVRQNNCVAGDFARDVTAEIRSGFDQVDRYYQEQMNVAHGGAPMGAMEDHSSMQSDEPSEDRALCEIGAERGSLTPPAPAAQGRPGEQTGGLLHAQTDGHITDERMEMMRRMGALLTRLSAHLVELERETGAANPRRLSPSPLFQVSTSDLEPPLTSSSRRRRVKGAATAIARGRVKTRRQAPRTARRAAVALLNRVRIELACRSPKPHRRATGEFSLFTARA